MSSKFKPIQYVEDDGLPVMEVGNWSQKKHKLVGKYCDIFSTGMKNKWNRIYLDLFTGPGFVKNRDSGQLMKNSALIALMTNLLNSRLIFSPKSHPFTIPSSSPPAKSGKSVFFSSNN